jgi:hypothetical protein
MSESDNRRRVAQVERAGQQTDMRFRALCNLEATVSSIPQRKESYIYTYMTFSPTSHVLCIRGDAFGCLCT